MSEIRKWEEKMQKRNGNFGRGVYVRVCGKKAEDLSKALKTLDKLSVRDGIKKETRRREHYISKGERGRNGRFFGKKRAESACDKNEILASERDSRFRLIEPEKVNTSKYNISRENFSSDSQYPDEGLLKKEFFLNKKTGNSLKDNEKKNKTQQKITVPDYEIKAVKVRVVSRIDNLFVVVRPKKIRDGQKVILSFPGGGIEDKEEEIQAAVREYKEEVGVKISLSPFDCFSYAYIDKPFKVVVAYATELEETVEFEKGDEIEEIYLMNKEEIDELVRKKTLLPNNIIIWNDYKKIFSRD